MDNLKNLKNYLNNLKGVKATMSSSGGGAGSIFKIEFGEFGFFFIYCTWRIEYNDKVLTTCNDTIDVETGLIPKATKELVNKTIAEIEMNNQYDLVISFAEGYKIRVFNDIERSETEYTTNWEFCIPKDDLYLEITNKFELIPHKYYK